MDRISITQRVQPTTQNTAPARTPKLIDPSARLRMADRADTAELSSVSKSQQVQKAVAADSVERLIAARVVAPAAKTEALTQNEPTVQGNAAMRFYTNPSDQNAAATLGAGSKLDVLA